MATATLGRRFPTWLSAVLPLVIIGGMVAVFLAFNPIGSLRETPPVETVAFERTVLREGEIELFVRNDGPDPVTLAQVLVNDAYWAFEVGDGELSRLESTRIEIAYPWEEGLPLSILLVTSTGVTIEHDIEAAALTPAVETSTILLYALLGVYIGVVPVAIGLLWFPSLRRAGKGMLTFLIAFTLGLLGFLLVDTVVEGLELARAAPASLDGLSLFVFGAVIAVLILTTVEAAIGAKRKSGAPGALSGLALAYLIALGIGLHNLGEGLAVGSALAVGEVALGTFLVLGFALHNTTEGLAIIAPLGGERTRPSLWHFAGLGLVAGAPTILGAWVGGFLFSATWAAVAFGLAAGAIGQVIWQISKGITGGKELASSAGAGGVLAGFLFMYLTGLLVA